VNTHNLKSVLQVLNAGLGGVSAAGVELIDRKIGSNFSDFHKIALGN